MGEYSAPAERSTARGCASRSSSPGSTSDITGELLDGARRALRDAGVAPEDVTVVWVPGAFELPLVAKHLASSGAVDASSASAR